MKSGFIIAVHNHGYEAMSEMYILRDFYGHDLDETRKHARRLINFAGCPEPTRVKGAPFLHSTAMTHRPHRMPAWTRFLRYGAGNPRTRIRQKREMPPWMTAWVDGNDLIVVCGPSEGCR